MKLENKNVLVTGADGFIGSHLVEMLVKKGAQVKALSYYNSFNNWGWLEEVSCLNEIKLVSGDIRDPFFCKEISMNIDIIFNLAALISIPYSYISPKSYFDTNVLGTLNICQAAHENRAERVIHVSTSEVYGTAIYVPIDEKHPLQPQSPYSASKIGADSVAMSYHYSFDLPVVIARPFNTYGPRQSARAVIPTIITQMAMNKKEIKIGDVTPTRDFNFVLDTCGGIIALTECDDCIGETINIGSNSEVSVGELFEIIKRLMENDAIYVSESQRIRPKKSEVRRLCADNAKLKSLTNFNPSYTLTEGLEITIQWLINAKNLKKYKPEVYNV